MDPYSLNPCCSGVNCNLLHQQDNEEKSHNHINRYRKNIWQNLTFISDKNSETENRNLLNLIQNIYKNPIFNIILNCNKIEAFSLRSGTRQGSALSPFLFNIILEVLANAVGEEWEGRNKTVSKDLLELGSDCSKVAGYKVKPQKSNAFLNTGNEQWKMKYIYLTKYV